MKCHCTDWCFIGLQPFGRVSLSENFPWHSCLLIWDRLKSVEKKKLQESRRGTLRNIFHMLVCNHGYSLFVTVVTVVHVFVTGLPAGAGQQTRDGSGHEVSTRSWPQCGQPAGWPQPPLGPGHSAQHGEGVSAARRSQNGEWMMTIELWLNDLSSDGQTDNSWIDPFPVHALTVTLMLLQAEDFNEAVQVVREWLPHAESELKFRPLPEDEEAIVHLIEHHDVSWEDYLYGRKLCKISYSWDIHYNHYDHGYRVSKRTSERSSPTLRGSSTCLMRSSRRVIRTQSDLSNTTSL